MSFLLKTNTLIIATLTIICVHFANGQTPILIGEPCTETSQCVGQPHSECTGVCSCAVNYTANSQLDNCLPIQNQLGGSCIESQQCQKGEPGPESICDNGLCRCGADFINPAGENKCYRKALKINDTCERDVQCTANLEHAVCLNGKCACTSDAVAGSNDAKCLQKMQLWGTCLEQGQCDHISNAVCVPAIGTDLTHSECRCSTANGIFVPNPNDRMRQCMKMAVYLGESCQDHEYQCNPVRYSHCNVTSRTCQCRDEDQVPSQDNRNCYAKMDSLNSPCSVSEQCQVANSTCLAWTCVCKDGFVEGTNPANRCLPVANQIGDDCQEDVQCADVAVDGSVVCSGGYCNCPRTIPPSHFFNGRCALPAKLDYPCESQAECHVGVNNLTDCVPKEGSMPPENWCSCMPNTIRLYDTCWGTKRIGDDCMITLECAISITGPMSCDETTKKCTCASGYVSGNSDMSCVQIPSNDTICASTATNDNGNDSGGNSLKHSFNKLTLLFAIVFMTVLFEKLY